MNVGLWIGHLQVENARHLVSEQLIHFCRRQSLVEPLSLHVTLRYNHRLVDVVTLDLNLFLLGVLDSTVKPTQSLLHLAHERFVLLVAVLVGLLFAGLLLEMLLAVVIESLASGRNVLVS